MSSEPTNPHSPVINFDLGSNQKRAAPPKKQEREREREREGWRERGGPGRRAKNPERETPVKCSSFRGIERWLAPAWF